MFTVPGMWKEERNIFPVDGNEGIRGGPFKENLYWLQDRQAGQAVPDVSHGLLGQINLSFTIDT